MTSYQTTSGSYLRNNPIIHFFSVVNLNHSKYFLTKLLLLYALYLVRFVFRQNLNYQQISLGKLIRVLASIHSCQLEILFVRGFTRVRMLKDTPHMPTLADMYVYT